jgi:hypothetical protein
MKYYTKPFISDMVINYETYSTKEILDEYFPEWTEMMVAGGKGNFIDEESCIQDWVILYHAWETDSESLHVLPLSASEGSQWTLGTSEWC